MADAKMRAHVVRIQLEECKSGQYLATSRDLKGLLVAERSVDAVLHAVPQAISDLYAACGVDVVVTKLDQELDDQRSWVAVRADLARQDHDLSRAERRVG